MWNNAKKALTFSFDDGVTQDIRLVELFNKYGLKGTFNLNSGLLGTKDSLVCNGIKVDHNKIPANEIKSVYFGHEIACHTLTHPHLLDLDDFTVIRQIEEDRKALESLCGYEIHGMAYPYGPTDDRIIRLIRENTPILYSRTTKVTHGFKQEGDLLDLKSTCHFGDEQIFDLAKKFLDYDGNEEVVFYIWAHAYELDADKPSWDALEELCKMLSGRKDVFYGTNSQVLLK